MIQWWQHLSISDAASHMALALFLIVAVGIIVGGKK